MDRKELESWLQTRPREDAILIAQRAALRVFPIWASRMGEGWARASGLTCGLLLRVLLTSGVGLKFKAPEVTTVASAAAAAAYHSATGAADRAATYGAAVAATADDVADSVDAAEDDAHACLAAVASASSSAAAAADDENAAFRAAAAVEFASDACRASAVADPLLACIDYDIARRTNDKGLLSTPLWPNDPPNEWLRAEQEGLELLARETGNRNSFWHRWYFAAKRGEWLDWDLQRDVALIPDVIWQQGPEAVAAAIREIEARHDLHQQVTALRHQVEALQAALEAASSASPAHRGHNNPPELLDIPAPAILLVNALLLPLQQAEAELIKPDPDLSVLRRLVAALKGFVAFSVAYCGKTLDTLVQEAAKSIGQQAGPGVKWWLLVGSAGPLLAALQQYLSH